jgi:DNA invertase Pin-like site-specific DNA recombinase
LKDGVDPLILKCVRKLAKNGEDIAEVMGQRRINVVLYRSCIAKVKDVNVVANLADPLDSALALFEPRWVLKSAEGFRGLVGRRKREAHCETLCIGLVGLRASVKGRFVFRQNSERAPRSGEKGPSPGRGSGQSSRRGHKEYQRKQAEVAGFKIDKVIADHGVCGVSTKLAERSQGCRLFDILRKDNTLVVRWVDRLGRNYPDVCDTIREFMRRGVVIRTVINNMTFDGASKDPMQQAVRDALIAFMAATAQAQAEATKEAQRAGIEHAKASGERYKGRKPSFTRNQFKTVQDLLRQDAGVSVIAKAAGLNRQTVYRIRNDAVGSEAALVTWGQ